LPQQKGLQRSDGVERQRGDRPAEISGGAVDGDQMRHGPGLDTPERPEIPEAIKNHHGQNPLRWSVVPLYWPPAANMLSASAKPPLFCLSMIFPENRFPLFRIML
jgi:hypothetical protein